MKTWQRFLLGGLVFQQGFAVVDGRPQTVVEDWGQDTVIVCRPTCTMVIDGKTTLMDVPGFGPFGQMAKMASAADEIKQLIYQRESKKAEKPLGEDKTVIPPEPTGPEEEEKEQVLPSEIISQLIVEDNAPLEDPNWKLYKVPYPEDQTIFLHTNGGRIFVLPEKKCLGSMCELTLLSGSQELEKKQFKKGEVPLASLVFKKSSEGTIDWKYKSNAGEKNGSFEIRLQTPESFGDALKANRPVEVIQ